MCVCAVQLLSLSILSSSHRIRFGGISAISAARYDHRVRILGEIVARAKPKVGCVVILGLERLEHTEVTLTYGNRYAHKIHATLFRSVFQMR